MSSLCDDFDESDDMEVRSNIERKIEIRSALVFVATGYQ